MLRESEQIPQWFKKLLISFLPTTKGTIMSHCRHRHYGFFNFLFDAILCLLTGGFWLIWVFVREMRG